MFTRDPTPSVSRLVQECDRIRAGLTRVTAGIRNCDTKFQLYLAVVLKLKEIKTWDLLVVTMFWDSMRQKNATDGQR